MDERLRRGVLRVCREASISDTIYEDSLYQVLIVACVADDRAFSLSALELYNNGSVPFTEADLASLCENVLKEARIWVGVLMTRCDALRTRVVECQNQAVAPARSVIQALSNIINAGEKFSVPLWVPIAYAIIIGIKNEQVQETLGVAINDAYVISQKKPAGMMVFTMDAIGEYIAINSSVLQGNWALRMILYGALALPETEDLSEFLQGQSDRGRE